MLSTLPPKVIPADEHVQNNLYKLLRLHHKAHCCWPDLAPARVVHWSRRGRTCEIPIKTGWEYNVDMYWLMRLPICRSKQAPERESPRTTPTLSFPHG